MQENNSIIQKDWIFVCNNYTAVEEALCQTMKGRKYMIYSREVGEQGTPHLQGYVQFTNAKGFAAVRKSFRDSVRFHIEAAKGNYQQNMDYVRKSRPEDVQAGVGPHPDSKLYEFGTPRLTMVEKQKKNGKKGGQAEIDRWKQIRIHAEKGQFTYDEQVNITHFNALRGIHREYLTSKPLSNLDEIDNYWIYGSTGVGKSHTARQVFGAEFGMIYQKNNNKWWDGYRDEPVVLMEEIDPINGAHISDRLKIWADKYPCPVEMKGSSRVVRPKHYVVTSNYTPREIWQSRQQYEPIERRFKIIYIEDRTHHYLVNPETDEKTPWVWPNYAPEHVVPDSDNESGGTLPLPSQGSQAEDEDDTDDTIRDIIDLCSSSGGESDSDVVSEDEL